MFNVFKTSDLQNTSRYSGIKNYVSLRTVTLHLTIKTFRYARFPALLIIFIVLRSSEDIRGRTVGYLYRRVVINQYKRFISGSSVHARFRQIRRVVTARPATDKQRNKMAAACFAGKRLQMAVAWLKTFFSVL